MKNPARQKSLWIIRLISMIMIVAFLFSDATVLSAAMPSIRNSLNSTLSNLSLSNTSTETTIPNTASCDAVDTKTGTSSDKFTETDTITKRKPIPLEIMALLTRLYNYDNFTDAQIKLLYDYLGLDYTKKAEQSEEFNKLIQVLFDSLSETTKKEIKFNEIIYKNKHDVFSKCSDEEKQLVYDYINADLTKTNKIDTIMNKLEKAGYNLMRSILILQIMAEGVFSYDEAVELFNTYKNRPERESLIRSVKSIAKYFDIDNIYENNLTTNDIYKSVKAERNKADKITLRSEYKKYTNNDAFILAKELTLQEYDQVNIMAAFSVAAALGVNPEDIIINNKQADALSAKNLSKSEKELYSSLPVNIDAVKEKIKEKKVLSQSESVEANEDDISALLEESLYLQVTLYIYVETAWYGEEYDYYYYYIDPEDASLGSESHYEFYGINYFSSAEEQSSWAASIDEYEEENYYGYHYHGCYTWSEGEYYPSVESFYISCNTTMVINSSQTCSIIPTPSNAYDADNTNFTWTSSNPSIISVSSTTGILTSNTNTGTCTITATHNDYTGLTDTIDVYVYGAEYYVDNIDSGKFFTTNSSYQVGHDIYVGNDYSKWFFNDVGNGKYTIVSRYNPNKILCCPTATSVSIESMPSSITDNYKWTVTTSGIGGVIIKNALYTDKVLYDTGSTVTINNVLSPGETDYKKSVWRIINPSSYIPLASFSVNCSDYMLTSSSQNCSITNATTGAQWITNTDFTWTPEYSSILTVSTTGVITSYLNAGVCNITVVHKPTGVTRVVTVNVVIDYEGTYFLQNSKYDEHYLQVDNNDAPNYSTSGTKMELWKFDGGDYQKWNFTWISGEYYKITSDKSGLALSVRAGYLNTGEQYLAQETYYGYDRQLWKITRTVRGTFVIRPKSGEAYTTDWCMASGDHFLGIVNGVNVEQRAYSNDSDYKDEWVLIGYQDASLIAIPETYDRSSYFPNIATQLSSIGFDEVFHNHISGIVCSDMSSGEVLARMMSSKIVLIRTHGNYTGIATSDGAINIDQLLSDFYGSFTMTQLVVYGACKTAQGGTSEQNFVTATVACGVDTAIGFRENVNAYATNFWCETFFEYLAAYYNDPNKDLEDVCDSTNYELEYSTSYTEEQKAGLLDDNMVLAGSTDFPSQ